MDIGNLKINRDPTNAVIWIGTAKVTVIPHGSRCSVLIQAPKSLAIVRGELLTDNADDYRASQAGPYRVQSDDGDHVWEHHSVHDLLKDAVQQSELVRFGGVKSRVVDCREFVVYLAPGCEMCDGTRMVMCASCSGSGLASSESHRPDDYGPHHICQVCDGDGDLVCPTCDGSGRLSIT